MKEKNIYISVVIPVFNEEENVKNLYDEITLVLKKVGKPYEIIFINDGSKDKTHSILEKIAKLDLSVKVLDFLRNFGQTAALSAGISASTGEIIIPMDGDGQNDPADIPKLLQKIEEGYTVVSGWRKNRKDPFVRVLPSLIANWIIARATGIKIHDNGCSLKAYRREIIEGVQLYGEMHRFIFIYAAWSGGKVAEIVVNHRPRKFGKSKYGFSRIFKVILDLTVVRFLFSYMSRPIHFFGKYGFYSIFAGFLLLLWSLVLKLSYGISLSRTPLLTMSTMFFIVGIQLILTGILAELMMRTYYESQNKKPYLIRSQLNKIDKND
ncbi:MAG: glycosyltransferase family 2 protein [Candidatus Berkelbacteria bacterium]|nr:glycosyltransferase family 2 protein [Candidatus Berkelbacteria bacterium]